MENEDKTVWEYLSRGRPIREISAELEDVYRQLETATPEQQQGLVGTNGPFAELLDYFDQYEADDILLSLIEEMKIDPDMLDMPLAVLSGGQKSNWPLRGCCIPKPEILCLDGPTNHLDAVTKDYVTDCHEKL